MKQFGALFFIMLNIKQHNILGVSFTLEQDVDLHFWGAQSLWISLTYSLLFLRSLIYRASCLFLFLWFWCLQFPVEFLVELLDKSRSVKKRELHQILDVKAWGRSKKVEGPWPPVWKVRGHAPLSTAYALLIVYIHSPSFSLFQLLLKVDLPFQ